jgi:hypothetical protein
MSRSIRLHILAAILAIPVLAHAEDLAPCGSRSPERLAMHTGPSAQTARHETAIAETEAQEWLGRVHTAWNTRDADTLVALGIIRTERADDLRRALGAYKELHVDLQNVLISVDGAHAAVSYDRVDTDETGKVLKFPRKTIQIERLSTGLVACR